MNEPEKKMDDKLSSILGLLLEVSDQIRRLGRSVTALFVVSGIVVGLLVSLLVRR